jgi:hypothetical protein
MDPNPKSTVIVAQKKHNPRIGTIKPQEWSNEKALWQDDHQEVPQPKDVQAPQ